MNGPGQRAGFVFSSGPATSTGSTPAARQTLPSLRPPMHDPIFAGAQPLWFQEIVPCWLQRIRGQALALFSPILSRRDCPLGGTGLRLLKLLVLPPITNFRRCGRQENSLVYLKETLNMSISGISGSSFFQANGPGNIQGKFQQFQKEFQQLGQDLQSGNLSQAQSDFAAMQQNSPAGSSASTTDSTFTSSSSSISQAFKQLSQDLQAGNLSAAQSDFSTIQQDLQQSGTQGTQGHHHHHHHQADASQGSSSNGLGSAINQAFGQLGQTLQGGNLPAAQQAYATLQQDFQQFAALGGSSNSGTSTSASGASSSLNVTA